MSLVFSHDGLNYEIRMENDSVRGLYCEGIDVSQYLERASRENVVKATAMLDLYRTIIRPYVEEDI